MFFPLSALAQFSSHKAAKTALWPSNYALSDKDLFSMQPLLLLPFVSGRCAQVSSQPLAAMNKWRRRNSLKVLSETTWGFSRSAGSMCGPLSKAVSHRGADPLHNSKWRRYREFWLQVIIKISDPRRFRARERRRRIEMLKKLKQIIQWFEARCLETICRRICIGKPRYRCDSCTPQN